MAIATVACFIIAYLLFLAPNSAGSTQLDERVEGPNNNLPFHFRTAVRGVVQQIPFSQSSFLRAPERRALASFLRRLRCLTSARSPQGFGTCGIVYLLLGLSSPRLQIADCRLGIRDLDTSLKNLNRAIRRIALDCGSLLPLWRQEYARTGLGDSSTGNQASRSQSTSKPSPRGIRIGLSVAHVTTWLHH